MQLDTIIFFGRTLAEYENFLSFNAEAYRGKRILDVAAGSASFAAEATGRGLDVTAVDPIYGRTRESVEAIARLDFNQAMQVVRAHPERYRMRGFADADALEAKRQEAMERFLYDYDQGRAQGRYQCGSLPRLGFRDRSFESVFCGHYLFLYADRLDFAFHREALVELMRIANNEVRLYPLISLKGELPFPLEDVFALAQEHGFVPERVRLNYEVFTGAVEMLVLRRDA